MTKGLVHEKGTFEKAQEHWLTPPALLQALGPFDLDPCACPEPRPWPTAKRHICTPQDGLAATWKGRVWCNPPYGNQVEAWMQKMAQHGSGIALIFARTDTGCWQRTIFKKATAILFLGGRVRFCRFSGEPAGTPGAPSALIAFSEADANVLNTCRLNGALWDL